MGFVPATGESTMPLPDRTVYRACNLCEAICGIAIEVKNGEIASIKGDPEDPFSRGHICPKAVALADIHKDPDRLRHPVRRTDSGWERIGWEKAFDLVASRLKETQRRHGRDAVAVYMGNPTVHNYGSMLFAPPFARSLGTRNRFSATSVDQLPHHLASAFQFGHPLLLPVPDLDRTDLLLVLGANPVASNGSMMTAPGVRRRLEALRARGGKLVVIDPRRTETATLADRHLFIRPGTDVFLLLGFLNAMFAENSIELGRLAAFTDGLADVAQAVADFTPERVGRTTGIEPSAIRELAREFARASSAVCYGRMGASTQAFGGLNLWLINVVNIVTGNLDRPGGAMFTTPAIDPIRRSKKPYRVRFNRWQSRVRRLPEASGELPVTALAEEILTEGEGQIRALVTMAGNPVLSTPNGRHLDWALNQLDFMAAVDFYINETTRHADVILPPTSPLEHDHYDLIFNLLAVRDTAKYSPAVFEAPADTKHDWEIFLELQTRMESNGGLSGLRARGRRILARRLGPAGIVDKALRRGPYGTRSGSRGHNRLILGKLRDLHPHGVDLGPLRPRLPERLMTPDKRIVLAPEIFLDDLERARRELETINPHPSGDGLLLVGRRHLRSNNSWMHNYHRLVKGRDRCTLMIHPADASARGLRNGQRARVASRVGEIEVPVEVTEQIMPGVVSIPHGWGHGRPGTRLGIANRHCGVSINDLTEDSRVDPLSGNAAFSGVPVEVEAIGTDA
jgi:anaerobic selenocysteine-containing dehydrogenase